MAVGIGNIPQGAYNVVAPLKVIQDLRIVTRHGWREICGNRDDVNLAGYRLPTFVFINRIRKKSRDPEA
jgi:hypothetical protein